MIDKPEIFVAALGIAETQALSSVSRTGRLWRWQDWHSCDMDDFWDHAQDQFDIPEAQRVPMPDEYLSYQDTTIHTRELLVCRVDGKFYRPLHDGFLFPGDCLKLTIIDTNGNLQTLTVMERPEKFFGAIPETGLRVTQEMMFVIQRCKP